jgi:ABC-type molybdenum transport system ATPase subunit/photorepair protein PhrA
LFNYFVVILFIFYSLPYISAFLTIMTKADESDSWSYESWLHEHEGKKEKDSLKKKHLALTWKNLVVTGVDSKSATGHDVASVVSPLDIFRGLRAPNTLTILHSMSGQVRPGEMMLVLGRPGSGCTSFLKAVANKRSSFKSVEGDVFYGSMVPHEAAKYRGSMLYNSEGMISLGTFMTALIIDR